MLTDDDDGVRLSRTGLRMFCRSIGGPFAVGRNRVRSENINFKQPKDRFETNTLLRAVSAANRVKILLTALLTTNLPVQQASLTRPLGA